MILIKALVRISLLTVATLPPALFLGVENTGKVLAGAMSMMLLNDVLHRLLVNNDAE